MSDKLITIATFDEPLQAELSKERLESENIKCFLTEDAGRSLYGYAVGRIKLQIIESDTTRALEILATGKKNDIDTETTEDIE